MAPGHQTPHGRTMKMKAGRTLNELAAEISRQANSKKDYIASTEAMVMFPDDVTDTKQGSVALRLGDMEPLGINDLGHDQIATHTGIPARYYRRMQEEAPALLANNVNEWFQKYPAKRMARTLDNRLRAFLSDAYRPLENIDLAEVVLPVVGDLGLMVLSGEITETKFYLKCVDKRIERDVPTGRKIGDGSHVFFDTVSPGLIISNSEVGHGSLAVDAGIFTSMCTNMATISNAGMKRRHTGVRHGLLGDDVRELLTDATKRATDRAIWMQVRDIVRGAFEEAKFDAHCQKLAGIAERRIEGDPLKVVELTAVRFAMNEDERTSVLRHLIEGGDLTQYGVMAAITRTASDLDSYDRASDFERFGGDVLELPANDWQALAKAA
jgi:hypothetical protein